MSKMRLKPFLETFSKFDIFTHVRPDGDAIGSSLALQAALIGAGKQARVFCPDVIPAKYSFLPGAGSICDDYSPGDVENTLAITLDCSDMNRLSYMKEDAREYKQLLNIDHHVTNEEFGNYNFIDTSAAATAEMIYCLLKEDSFQLTEEISLCLYVGLTTDTGSFKYENTTSKTLQVAGELLANGVNPIVGYRVIDEYPLSTLLLLRDALSTLKLNQEKTVAWMQVTEEMVRRNGALPEELDGFVNYLRNIQSVDVAVLFYHKEDDETKVGFRSKKTDVASIARYFAGGGHPRAAGCSLTGNAEEICQTVLSKIEGDLAEVSAASKKS